MIKAKLISGQRYIHWHYFTRFSTNVRITEFPRSGGTWLSKMLAELFVLPFPQKSLLPWHQCIEHAHYVGPYSDKTIYVIRDGRDVLTSSFFHFLTYRENKPTHLVDKWRKVVDYSEESSSELQMARFIELFSNKFTIGGRQVSWSNHVTSFDPEDPEIIIIKYEDMLNCSENILERVCSFLQLRPKKSIADVVRNNSFASLAKRQRGVEVKNDFYRKGISGDWKNHFNDDALNVFMSLHGNALRKWGYD